MRIKTEHCCPTLQISCHLFELRFPDGHVNINFKHSIYIHTYQVSWLTSDHFTSFVNPEEVEIIAYYL